MKKNLLIRVLLLLTLLVVCAASSALADEDLTIDNDLLRSTCWQGDTLYLLGNETIYRWQPGDAAPQPVWRAEGIEMMRWMDVPPEDETELALWRQAVSYLVPGKDAPLALQSYSGEVFSIGAEGLSSVAAVPAEYLTLAMDDMTMPREIYNVTGRYGVIWLLLGTDDVTDWGKQSILRFDTADSSVKTFDVHGVMHIAAAEDGNLLLSADMDWATCASYRLVNGETGEVIREYEGGGELAVWAQGNVLEYRGGELLQLDGAGMRTNKGYVPLGSQLAGSLTCSDGGLCAVDYGSYLFIRDLKQPSEKTVLKLAGTLGPNELISFNAENPDIAVITLGESVQQAAMTGSADMLIVIAPGLYGTLAERRGLAPISDDRLTEIASTFYESIREAIAPDGQLLAWPIQMQTETWSLDETLWAQFDLGEVPTTYAALMDTLERWQNDYADDEPDYKLAELPGSLAGCLQLMMREYILQCGDEYPDFTSEDFRQAALALIAHQNIIERNAENGWMPFIYSYPMGFGLTSIDSDWVRMMPQPAISGDSGQKVAVTMKLLTISSACKQQDAALRFIRWYADHMDTLLLYQLCPSKNTPVRKNNYQARLDDLNAQKAALEASLSAAEGTEAADLREQLTYLEQRIVNWENESGWLISEASIANYREVATHLVVPYRSPLLQSEGGMASMDERIELACGQGLTEATLDHLLNELSSVARMVMMENQ